LHALFPPRGEPADQRLWIASPYFIPDEQFISALQLATLRGVDVRLLSRANPTARSLRCRIGCVASLMNVGVKVYRYPGFTHQKVVLVDDDYAWARLTLMTALSD
jgi:cardiolipin synthase